MKRILTNLFAAIFAAAAVLAAAGAVSFCAAQLDQPPRLLTPAVEAQAKAQDFLDAVCRGDYTDAQSFLLGQPELGADRQAADPVGVLVWDAYIASLDYTLVGDCYVTDEGIAQNVQLRFLDLDAATAGLRRRSETLLAQLQRSAEDVSELYDEDGNYRRELVMDVVHTAAEQALQEDGALTSVTLTLTLTWREDQWWVVPDEALLQAISGGLSG